MSGSSDIDQALALAATLHARGVLSAQEKADLDAGIARGHRKVGPTFLSDLGKTNGGVSNKKKNKKKTRKVSKPGMAADAGVTEALALAEQLLGEGILGASEHTALIKGIRTGHVKAGDIAPILSDLGKIDKVNPTAARARKNSALVVVGSPPAAADRGRAKSICDVVQTFHAVKGAAEVWLNRTGALARNRGDSLGQQDARLVEEQVQMEGGSAGAAKGFNASNPMTDPGAHREADFVLRKATRRASTAHRLDLHKRSMVKGGFGPSATAKQALRKGSVGRSRAASIAAADVKARERSGPGVPRAAGAVRARAATAPVGPDEENAALAAALAVKKVHKANRKAKAKAKKANKKAMQTVGRGGSGGGGGSGDGGSSSSTSSDSSSGNSSSDSSDSDHGDICVLVESAAKGCGCGRESAASAGPAGASVAGPSSRRLSATGLLLHGDWTDVTDDDGQVYYFNTVTEETRWTLPPAEGSTGAGGQWAACRTDEGETYYVDTTTDETRWEKPPGWGGVGCGAQAELQERRSPTVPEPRSPQLPEPTNFASPSLSSSPGRIRNSRKGAKASSACDSGNGGGGGGSAGSKGVVSFMAATGAGAVGMASSLAKGAPTPPPPPSPSSTNASKQPRMSVMVREVEGRVREEVERELHVEREDMRAEIRRQMKREQEAAMAEALAKAKTQQEELQHQVERLQQQLETNGNSGGGGSGSGGAAKVPTLEEVRAQPKFKQYSTMLKMHLPDGAIRQKMTINGVSDEDQKVFFGEIQPFAAKASKVPTLDEVRKQPKYATYLGMLKMHLPEGAIRQKMGVNSLSEHEVAVFFGEAAPVLHAAAPKLAEKGGGLLAQIGGGVKLKKAGDRAPTLKSSGRKMSHQGNGEKKPMSMLEELQAGKKLKKAGSRAAAPVKEETAEKKPMSMLEELQAGKKLKKADSRAVAPVKEETAEKKPMTMMEEMQAKARKRAESAAANPQAISPRGKPVKEKAVDAKKPMTMMEEMQAKARKRAASAAASSPQPAAPRGAPMATSTPTSTPTPSTTPTPTPSTAAREGASIAAAASAPVPAAATSSAAAGGSAPAGGAGGVLPPLAPGEITFTLAQLSGKGGGGQAAELERIDQTQREMYLSDADVQQYFGCQLWELPAMPKWKRTKKKKDLGLF
jgi:hypothetical protein